MTVEPELHRLMSFAAIKVVDEFGECFLGHPEVPFW
jgi:hypothetical protein